MPEIKSIFHSLLARDIERNVWHVFKLCANQKDYYSEIHMIKCSIHVIKYFKSFLRRLNLLADAAWHRVAETEVRTYWFVCWQLCSYVWCKPILDMTCNIFKFLIICHLRGTRWLCSFLHGAIYGDLELVCKTLCEILC